MLMRCKLQSACACIENIMQNWFYTWIMTWANLAFVACPIHSDTFSTPKAPGLSPFLHLTPSDLSTHVLFGHGLYLIYLTLYKFHKATHLGGVQEHRQCPGHLCLQCSLLNVLWMLIFRNRATPTLFWQGWIPILKGENSRYEKIGCQRPSWSESSGLRPGDL